MTGNCDVTLPTRFCFRIRAPTLLGVFYFETDWLLCAFQFGKLSSVELSGHCQPVTRPRPAYCCDETKGVVN